jgi:hypothetical protein
MVDECDGRLCIIKVCVCVCEVTKSCCEMEKDLRQLDGDKVSLVLHCRSEKQRLEFSSIVARKCVAVMDGEARSRSEESVGDER